MRCFIIIIVYFAFIVNGRPTQNEGAPDVELEYEVELDEKDSRLKQENQDPLSDEQNDRFEEMGKNSDPSGSLNKDRDNAEFSDNKHAKSKEEREINTDDESNVFEDFKFYPKRRQTARYFQSNDDQHDTQRANNRNVNSFKTNHNSILTDESLSKRMAQDSKSSLGQENDLLFEKEQNDKSDCSNESKLYYSEMRPETLKKKSSDNDRFYYSRDRRDVENYQPNSDNLSIGDQNQNENVDPSGEEDGEAAIKKHIQKLSSDELQDLMNSLSKEKQNLLNSIIDDLNLTDSDAVHKREITKKAEAVEDNSFNDDSKIQSGSVSVTHSVLSENTDAPNSNKADSSKTFNLDTSSTKHTENSNIESKSINPEPSEQQKSDDAVNSGSKIESDEKSEIVSNDPVTTKNANKREINSKDLADMSNEDQSYFCPHDEDPQILDDEEQLQFDQESKSFKRDVDQNAELDSKMKPLLDSFPNSENYDESPGPLVRVKRKNLNANLKKRSAALLPDAKVAFFPYRSESDDDDEEGNEFDDEGFYERAHVCNKNIEDDSSAAKEYRDARPNSDDRQVQVSEFNKVKDSKLGTDTDSVLSGVNEVDENLMFSSSLRNIRTPKDNQLSNNHDSSVQSFDSKSSDDESKVISQSNVNNIPNYQESDALESLPGSYDGDLGSDKRLRRVKQPQADEPSSDT